ncbi:uncharacterized protein NPIL_82131 [Nephila pilipes]|uniref:Gustatory receptor n=1 Tax=Nephila pilipes TaxID=299642 RepID=A0A8X6QV46_NEPPI|nr:uncharacterized protein NPIL_82131 [Nephila pilipes]
MKKSMSNSINVTDDPFLIIKKIVLLFGLDIQYNIRRLRTWNSKLRMFYEKCVALLWFCFIVKSIVTFFSYDIDSGESVTAKVSRKLNDIIAFSVWAMLVMKRKNIFRLFKDIHALGIDLNVRLTSPILYVGLVTILAIPLFEWLFKTLPMQNDDCKILVKYYSVNIMSTQNCKPWYFIALFETFFSYTVRTFYAVTYIILCWALRRILNSHSSGKSDMVRNLSLSYDPHRFEHYLVKNESIIQVLKYFEKTMSFPIFLIEIGDLFEMFLGLTWLNFRRKVTKDIWLLRYSIGTCFSAVRALVFFLCVSLAAASVHEGSEKCKDAQGIILKNALYSKPKVNTRDIIHLLILHQTPTFKLSASGFFYFTKGLVLSAIGSVLTYSLLIIQQVDDYKS